MKNLASMRASGHVGNDTLARNSMNTGLCAPFFICFYHCFYQLVCGLNWTGFDVGSQCQADFFGRKHVQLERSLRMFA